MEVNKDFKVGLPICAYTAFIILLYARTEISGFKIYVSVLILIAAVLMALNILKLSPSKFRMRCAVWELGYCITVYFLMYYLNYMVGNILSSVFVIVGCIIYLKVINPKYLHRNIFPN